MSTSGITSSMFSQMQQFQQDFQQLGQDLQVGQSFCRAVRFCDPAERYAANQFHVVVNVAKQSPMAQAFNQLSQDLQSGNLSAAQKDYSTHSAGLPKPGFPDQATIITTSREVSRARFPNCSLSWVRICSPAICQMRSRTSASLQQLLQGSSAQVRLRVHVHGSVGNA